MTHIISDVFRTLALTCLFSLLTYPVLYGQTVTVSGAGSTDFNTNFTYDTDISSKPSYLGGLCDEYTLAWDGSEWAITALGLPIYTNSNDTPKPPDSDWQISNGSAPAPTMSGDVTSLPFPVEFLSISGESTEEGAVQLSWITASELNNTGFEIQRSTESHKWESLGFVAGAGTTNELRTYHYTDSTAPAQRTAYRLKQIDLDGLYSFSTKIEVDMRDQLEDMEVYPNPVNGAFLTVHIPGTDHAILTATIRNTLGQVVQEAAVFSGENQLAMAGLAPGIYTLEVYVRGQSRIERFQIK